jgi:pimeloyl-ACP methyl ester carboxylesterase
LHFVCRGSGAPAVLLEASGPANAIQYSRVLPELESTTTACAYDRAGMGYSDPSGGRRTAQDMVDDLAAGLTAASIPGPYLLVAGSLGGIVAELFAREKARDVVGLILLDALTSENVGDPVTATFTRPACGARWAAEVGLLRLVDPFGLARADPLAFELTYRASTWRAICASVRALPESAAQLRAAPPLRHDLPLTVIVHGDPRGFIPAASAEEERAADPRWISGQRAFAARSSRGRVVVATGSGHLIASERPEVVVDAVKAMLAERRERDAGDAPPLDVGGPP